MTLFLLRLLSCLLIISSLLPLVKLDYWWIRVFDYPRVQKLTIVILILLGWVYLDYGSSNLEPWIWIGSLGLCASFLIIKIFPFTVLGKKMIETVPFDENNGIQILVSNVYQYNTKFEKLTSLIDEVKPDLIFLVETDQRWEKGISSIENSYPNTIKLPQDNTYGLLLYTNLEIVNQEIHHWIDDEIPSLELDIRLRNGKIITIYAIHPTPPVPGENEKSTDRDAEILLVGKKAKANNNPTMVIGDLNDVAWSYTTELFLKNSELVDPRRGRGLFNTFHAKIPLMRWPLDHVFLSEEFGLADIRVQKAIGSDHFPISLNAVLCADKVTEIKKANEKEKKEAREKISRA
jgi:endonuclease/exonuclease/phosphatase (EEP) superfamily protein YafD